MIGFCTVQDSETFGADFRIAKSAVQPTLDVQFAPFNGLTVAIAGGASDYVFAGPVAMNGSGGFLPALGVTAGIVAYTP